MDTQFLRQTMLAKLEEFKAFHSLYEDNIKRNLSFIENNLDQEHKEDFHAFMVEKADLEQWADDMIKEIKVDTKILGGFYQHAHENYKEQKDAHPAMIISHKGIMVERELLPRGSVVRSIGYNPLARVLDVEYNNGTVYRYSQVPKAVFHALSQDHPGTSINDKIKGKYKYELIEGVEDN